MPVVFKSPVSRGLVDRPLSVAAFTVDGLLEYREFDTKVD